MVPIFIASNRSFSGKTFLALGIAQKLIELGYKVGYLKPLGKMPVKKGSDLYDADAIFIRESLALPDPINVISPFVLSYEMQNLIFEGKLGDIKKQILAAFNAQKDKDFVIIGGAGDFFEGSTLGIDAASLIEETGARVVMVEAWRGDKSIDSLYGGSKLIGERFVGGIFNKVPANSLSYVKETAAPFLEKSGVAIFGIFQKDSLLESITIRQIVEILNGKVLCCAENIDDLVEHFSIGAMDVNSALNYFSRVRNKAVITGAHRSDIQLVAMETSTKCIIITGGLHTNDVVLGKAQSKGIPIVSVPLDTFTVVDRIEAVIGKTSIRQKEKTLRIKELIDSQFNADRMLKLLLTA
jgi:BioD-like phosphotransacetylase family protein